MPILRNELLCRCRFLALSVFLVSSCVSVSHKKVPLGTYWSPDYNVYLQVSDTLIERYQYSTSYCFPAAAGLIPKVQRNGPQIGQHYWQLQSNNALLLTRLSDGVSVVFHPVEGLPSACGQTTVDTATANLRVLLEILQQANQLPPKDQIKQLTNQASEIDAIVYESEISYRLKTFDVLTQALALTRDPHAFIYDRQLEQLAYAAPVPLKRRAKPSVMTYRQTLETINAQGFGCQQQLWHGTAGKEKHRLVVFSLSGFSPGGYGDDQHRCLNSFLRKVADTLANKAPLDVFYINLAYNPGGSLLLASQLLHALVANAKPIAHIKAQPIDYSSPSLLAHHYHHLFIEVSGQTASAAEYLASALYRQVPNVSVIGGPTRGALSSTLVKALPNGTILQLSQL